MSLEDIMSSSSIKINFGKSPKSNQHNKVMNALLEQLKIKDEQLAEKMEL